MTKKEFEEWFKLKQVLARLILRDIKEDWKAGNIPSTPRKIYEMSSVVNGIIEECFIYLRELGEIYILSNRVNNSDMILEIDMLEKWGIIFDQDQKE